MERFRTKAGAEIPFSSDLEQLKVEHVLQSDRDAWVVIPAWPYLAIDRRRLRSKVRELGKFPVFSCGQLWQNMRGIDIGSRIISSLAGSGTTAGLGSNSRAFVEGKANAKANFLLNWNAPLIVGTTPWCAVGTRMIYVDNQDLYQYAFGELITVHGQSRPSSPHFDFTDLADLRDRYNFEYLKGPKDGSRDLNKLADLLDQTFAQNSLSLSTAEAYHSSIAPTLSSVDYEPPILTKYDRVTHDTSGLPKIQVSFALLHYEKAILELNAVKTSHALNKFDEAFAHGVFCVVAAAACLEAISNHLVYTQTSMHPAYSDKRTPLQKINDAAAAIASAQGNAYCPLVAGQPWFDTLDLVRLLRNQFMHAKELENDIDATFRTSTLLKKIDEAACRSYLQALRLSMEQIYAQLPGLVAPIVIKSNVKWMGDMEVP